MVQLILLFSLIYVCNSFIHDYLSHSILPHISIREIGYGDRKFIFDKSNDYSVPPTTYELLCNKTLNLIEFYDTTNDVAVIAVAKEDYQVLCEGHRHSEAASSCIAIGRNKHGSSMIAQIDIMHDSIDSTFDEILFDNPDINILWDLNYSLSENALWNIPEILYIYQTIEQLAPSMILSSLKLAAGGDYNGVSDCVDKFHIWTMHLANAFSTHLQKIDINSKLTQIISDISCIKEATDNHRNKQRPNSIKKAKYYCPDTLRQHKLRNTTTYTKHTVKQIEASIKNRNHCPVTLHNIQACNVRNFGVCGLEEQCWNWVCNSNKYNGQVNCGCNNGCYEQDYYCHCVSPFSIECWGLVHSFISADAECHAGSTCVTVDSVENIFDVNKCQDETFYDDCLAGDPYVWLFPTEPEIGRDVQTDYAESFHGNDLYDIQKNRHCWSMQFDNIRAELWDYDKDFDDFEHSFGDLRVPKSENISRMIHVSTGITKPKITLSVERRGW